MILSVDTEKAFDKIQHPFLIKTFSESGHTGSQPQHNKGHIWQTHSEYHSQSWKAERLPAVMRKKTRLSTLTTALTQILPNSPSHTSHLNTLAFTHHHSPSPIPRGQKLTGTHHQGRLHSCLEPSLLVSALLTDPPLPEPSACVNMYLADPVTHLCWLFATQMNTQV